MKISMHSITLSFEDFLLLLDKHGLTIPKDSDLAPLLSITPATDAGSLEAEGLLDKEPLWIEALQAICDPAYQVDSATFLAQSTLATSYFSGKNAKQTFVACSPNNGRVRIAFPFTPEELLQKEMQAFGIGGSMAAKEHTYALSADGLFLCAAAIDAIREVMLASLAHRVVVSKFELPVSGLDAMLASSINDPQTDARWLVSLLRIAAPTAYIPNREALNHEALDELVEQKLITMIDAHNWIPSPELLAIAHDLFVPIPALMIQTQTIRTNGERSENRSLNFNGRNGLSTIDFIMNAGAPIANYHRVSREEFWLNLTNAVTPPVYKEEIIEKKKATPKFCSGCGSSLQPTVNFCTNCGTQV